MENTDHAGENSLETRSVGRLIANYAIPCAVSLVINGLYNIVDQIFIGNGVGYLGNGATNVVFPLTILCVALGVLFGDGAATYLSIKLGVGSEKEARAGAVNGILLSVLAAILLTGATAIFLRPIVYLFGCTATIEPYALGYGSIVMAGFPFVLVATTLNSVIRADGSPGWAMVSLVSGAVFNTVMDPVFIFLFHWGVQGAALVTILGQMISFLISVTYLGKWKSIRPGRGDWRLRTRYIRAIVPLGVSSFINQIATVVMTAVINNMLAIYGARSAYGTDIPLAVMGITLKVNQILIFIVVGIATGAQPVIGYHYGAGNIGRVMEALRICVLAAIAASAAAFLVFQLAPMSIVSLFGAESALYNEFAVKSLRVYLLLCVLNGFQTVASIFVQAIQRPARAIALSLSRQIAFLIPAVVLLPRALGIEGVLWAGPLADALAFFLALAVLASEIHRLRKMAIENPREAVARAESQNNP